MKARENPFAAARVLSIRYRVPDGGAAALLARLRQLGYRAAIVGRHGSGKTTLLEDLEKDLEGLGFRIRRLRLDAEHRRFPRRMLSRFFAGVDSRDLVCFDGAEQLSVARWMAFRWRARHAGGLVITTHRRGRLPTLIECTTSPELLQALIERLTRPATTADEEETAGPGAPTASELFERHRGNLRDALRELYDVYADRTIDRIKGLTTARERRAPPADR